MGHHTDKLYVTHSEHASGSHTAGSSGHQRSAGAGTSSSTFGQFARLPFDHCALSLKPFENPVATREGIVYDLMNIIPFIRKYNLDPVSGRPLTSSSLVPLQFSRNSEGDYCDPLTFKPFTHHSAIVAVAKSGNVYSKETVDRLNVKAGHWRDLINDEVEFEKNDIIIIQDPNDPTPRDLSQFHHLKNSLKIALGDDSPSINLSSGVGGILDKIEASRSAKTKQAKAISDGDGDEDDTRAKATKRKLKDTDSEDVAAEAANGKQVAISNGKGKEKDVIPYNAASYSTGRATASLTSTTMDVHTRNDRALIDEEEYMFSQIKEKAYVRLQTNVGNINLELHADRAPKTCYNFIMLAKQGKYTDTIFHRLIPGFMVQGGDPTGSGSGGESYWGKPFDDEFNKRNAFKHDSRGILSMANRGANTNSSQFFLTFRATSNLDGKHTVFGRLVGGEETLTRMESVGVDPKTDRPTKRLSVKEVMVFKDPFEEWKGKLERRLKREEEERIRQAENGRKKEVRDKDRTTWFGTNLQSKPQEELELPSTVGKYLGGDAAGAGKKRKVGTQDSAGDVWDGGLGTKKKRKGGGFGSFEGW